MTDPPCAKIIARRNGRCRCRVVRDGWCTIHHPAHERAREAAAEQRSAAKRAEERAASERRAVALLRELGYAVSAPTYCERSGSDG